MGQARVRVAIDYQCNGQLVACAHSIDTEINGLEQPLRTLLKFVQNMHLSEPTMKIC